MTDVAALSLREALLERIRARTARIGVIGLGYVGLPLAVEFARAGFEVTGIDLSASKCAELNAGRSYVGDVPSDVVADLVAGGRLRASSDYAALAGPSAEPRRNGHGRNGQDGSDAAAGAVDAAIICVPTPLGKSKDPDISYIVAAADALAPIMHEGMLVVLESTTYPGTTEEVILPRIRRNGFRPGENIFLAFSPERVDPGNRTWNTRNTPKVVGGLTPACLEVATALYGAAVERLVPVSSPAAAEMVKILENTFRAVNIGLANEMAQICHRLGIDIWEVIEAASTKPFGYMPFYPGPGLGGHCIPIDPLYLTWKMRGLGLQTRFIELADAVNTAMPHWWVSRVQDALNEAGKPLKGARVLLLGVAYKADIDDLRESPALTILQELRARGASVVYNDPHVPTLRLGAETLSSAPLTAELVRWADCVLVHTAHAAYAWGWVAEHARLVVDTRHVVGEG